MLQLLFALSFLSQLYVHLYFPSIFSGKNPSFTKVYDDNIQDTNGQ